MLNVDAQTQRTKDHGVLHLPDQAILPVVLELQAPTAELAHIAGRATFEKLEAALKPHRALLHAVRVASNREKLLKTGVFGHGVRVSTRYELEVTLDLAADWDFWERLSRVESVRTMLHGWADGHPGTSVGSARWALSTLAEAGDVATSELADQIQRQATLFGLSIATLTPNLVSVSFEGPTRAVVSATATFTLAPSASTIDSAA